jgi:hypothetical protein
MKALFFNSNPPAIFIKFEDLNNSCYKYTGMDLGELNILKKKYYKKVGKLVDYLKSKSYIKYKKVISL